jgi:hypothetical protein
MLELRSRLLCVLDLTLGEVTLFGDTPYGTRRMVQVVGGSFEGPRLRGTVVGGGDWSLVGSDGALRLDARSTLRTDDGALLYVSYRGIRHGPPEVMQALLRGDEVAPDRYYFRTAPAFETAAEKYAWLNRIVAVGVGERRPAGPRYTIHEIL